MDIKREAFNKLQTKITTVSLHALSVNKVFPHDIAFAGPEYLGLQIPNLYLYQGVVKVKLYMSHMRRQNRTSKLMRILKDQLELLTGKGRDPLEFPEDCLLEWVPSSWLVGLGQFLHSCRGALKSEGERVISLQREGD